MDARDLTKVSTRWRPEVFATSKVIYTEWVQSTHTAVFGEDPSDFDFQRGRLKEL